VRNLTEPKNAIIKQYQKIYSFENNEHEFEKEAIEEIAHIALERKTGARGLRSVLEQMMLDLMYEIPSGNNIDKIIITKDMIIKQSDPVIKYSKKEKTA
jgi:ATP-dependent Clp protease ATP-binding subunit ClpX